MKTSRLNDLITVNRLAPDIEDVTNEELDAWIDFWESEAQVGVALTATAQAEAPVDVY